MKPSNLWALASAEVRSCRRLARTWVFTALALVLCLAIWITQSIEHFENSSFSPGPGLDSPRYMMEGLGAQILLFFTVGILFLAFDVRSRDIRDRIGEVMDIRPVSNLELLSGRLLGVILLLAIPAIAVVLFMLGFGWLAAGMGAPFDGLIEPVSVFSFLVWDIVPNLVLWGSLTYFVAIVLRYRILVALVVLGLMLGLFFLMRNLPADVASALSIRGLAVYPSELAPQFASFNSVCMRIVMLLISGGLLAVAAVVHPRVERKSLRVPQLTSGLILVAIACVGVFGMFRIVQFERNQISQWAEVHSQIQTHSSTNIQSISGSVDIRPGKNIDLDLTLLLSTNADSTVSDWLLSLNPGYHIDELFVDGESTGDYEFEYGLLTIPKSVASEEGPQVRIVASGMPNERFAYLDSAVNARMPETAQHARELFELGQKSYIQHPEYVVLMPRVFWFPSSGSAFGTTEWDSTGNDYFELDLEVSVPKGWIVAGPGKRTSETKSSRTYFHFSPEVPIRDLALVGSKFDRFSTVVQGIEFEILFSKRHRRYLSTLRDIEPALNDWIEKRVVEWNLAGIEYPFETLSLVEVPVTLRVFGGGWRMDSVFAQPGLLLLRESGLPIARFEKVLDNMPDDIAESDEKRSEYILESVAEFFKHDQAGGNPLANVSKNFVLFQSMATENGATAINYFINELSKLVVTGTDENSHFSLYIAMGASQGVRSRVIFSFDRTYEATPRVWHEGFTDRPPVWERLSETSLTGIDLNDDPDIASRVLFLRTNALAHQVLEHYGMERSGALLAELARRYSGSTFTRREFLQTALDVGVDFAEITGDWLDGQGLPGFIAAEAKTERLQDTETGESVYQTSFVLRNDEPTPGVVTVSYQTQAGDGDGFARSLPAFRVEGETSLQIAFQDSQPTGRIWITPEISLNRRFLQIDVDELEDFAPTDSPVLPTITKIDWQSPDAQSIVVDDLDDGFSVLNNEDTSEESSSMPPWLAFLFSVGFSVGTEVDEGLPQFNIFSEDHGQWSRQESRSSHGKYRQTHAIARTQSEESPARATFAATLPSPGKWRLEYHLPSVIPADITSVSNVAFGLGGVGASTSFTISTSGGRGSSGNEEEEPDFFLVEAKFDDRSEAIKVEPSFASRGWLELGTFDIESSEVEVVVSPGTSRFSVADAVKWTKVENED